ncbi:geranylgeranyl pyrophosphate synthetase [Colletotrichum truncatum]|uniref:Geranylgeranyl pyrophosphate synthetase n=1 Tax=Colletotrichum truncatum TaxID=5467 RepID=A0ACC3YL79_COLTU|nr:geranylgeranyl pyrophosphate synthetase [Colletotrichum truncatum]KAF6782629.1 geranylgeranyl pyrophosphate synthetase [Colletotrichum truncatum]
MSNASKGSLICPDTSLSLLDHSSFHTIFFWTHDQKKHNMYQHNMYQRNRHWHRRPGPEKPSPGPAFGSLLESINIADLSKPALAFVSSAQVTECELIASYNWLDRAKPSILIPGAPAKWTPPAETTALREDNGVYYRDKNASRYPTHPMEPAIQAVLSMHPDSLTRKVNLVACGSTLGNLLRFVQGKERPFRMLVEVVGSTVHLIRRENSPTETIDDVRGYGHTFPETYTSWDVDVRGSASHQRVLRYDFGGLSCLVRYEGDGYLKNKLMSSSGYAEREVGTGEGTVEELIASLGGNKVSQTSPGSSSQLQMQSGGFKVPQSAMFDLKTRSSRRKGHDFLGEELPRMWVAQIPNFVLAYHDRGTFNDIQIMDVSTKIKEWEKEKNEELSRLAALLHHIVNLVRIHGGKLEISRQSPEKLEFREQTPGLSGVCSVDVMAKWGAWLGSTVASSEDEGEYDSDVGGSGLAWSDGEDESDDFTACSQECSYCGRCEY